MQQVTGFMSNDFGIVNPQGVQVGRVHTIGSGAKRFFMGSREFQLFDADGGYLLGIKDLVTFGRDRWELRDTAGAPLADIVRRFTFFMKKIDVQVVDGPLLQVQAADIFDFGFGITADGVEIARTSRQWAGVGNTLLGRDRYVLNFRPDVRPRDRVAIIGAMIALDLMRQKDQSS
jgi:uncharacterized protein YxjI